MQKNSDDDEAEFQLVIKDLDTGQQFSVNDSTIEVMLQEYTHVSPKGENKWGAFWKRVNELNEQLWDACENGDVESVQELLKDQTTMQKQVEEARMNKTQSFVQFDKDLATLVDVNSKGLDDWTALHHAVNSQSVQLVQILLDAKANPKMVTQMKRTPLHIACLRHNIQIAQLLLQHNVDINCQDSDFNTPLIIAAEIGHEEMVKFLIDNKADASIRNYQGRTAFDCTQNTNVRNILRAHTPDMNNAYGRTELEGVIVQNGRADHVQRLLAMNQKQQKMASPQLKKEVQRHRMHQITTVTIRQIGPGSYAFHKLLGKGSFGEVYLASKKDDNTIYAIKTLNKEKVFTKNLTRYAQTEKNVLSVMKHPFIVRLHAAFQDNTKLFLVLDYCPGGDMGGLLTKYTKFSEEIARFYISEILLALEALHKDCIIFRDLKPDNVVIDSEGHARLTDFGLSKQGVSTNITKSFCGSIAYLAPEVLMKRGHSRTVDWYLLGVLLYEMIVGIPPYYNQNREVLFENIKKGSLRIPKSMSEEAKDLIKQLLIRDPAQRLGCKNDAQDIKTHPFFKNINWIELEERKKPGPYVEKDKTQQFLGQTVDINIESGDGVQKRIEDWSFVQ